MADIAKIGIVGAGFMGSGIAESAARAGIEVTLHEPDELPLKRSKARIETSVERAVPNAAPGEEGRAAGGQAAA